MVRSKWQTEDGCWTTRIRPELHAVTVKATDSFRADSATVTVTVMVNDVNELPPVTSQTAAAIG